MSENFGLRIGLEGEREFKKALSDINASFKVLGSEMTLVSSQFDKNDRSVQALTSRNEVLNREIEAQKQKIETLRAALDNAASSFGENDRRTQNWQIQLNKAQAELNGMERELGENNKALDSAESNLDEAGKEAKQFGKEIDKAGDQSKDAGGKFQKVADIAGKVGAAMAASVAAIGAAAIAAGKQLWDMANDVAAAGNEIDKTSQKIGISAESFQEWSYVFERSGADVNGLQNGMKKLSGVIADAAAGSSSAAAKLEAVGLSIDDLNGKSQDEQMSIVIAALQDMEAGAERTAAANDLLGKSATDMAAVLNMTAEETNALKQEAHDYGMIMSNDAVAAAASFEDSLSKLNGTMGGLKNRMIGDLLPGISDLVAGNENAGNELKQGVKSIIGSITNMIPQAISIISTVASAVLECAPEIITSLANGILTALPMLLPVALEVIGQLLSSLLDLLPRVVETGMMVISSVILGISQALPTLIPQVVSIVVQVVETLIGNLDMILDAALQLVEGLARGILDAIPVLLDSLPVLIDSLLSFILSAIPQVIETGISLLSSLVSALPTIVSKVVSAIPVIIDGVLSAVLGAIPQLIQAGISLLISLIQALPVIITTICSAIPQIIGGICDAILGHLDDIIMAGVTLFVSLIQNLPTILVEICKAVPMIVEGLVSSFGALIGKFAEVGGNIVKGLWEGIKGLASWIWDKVSGWASDLWNGICDFFGIHSPSRKFAWAGEMMAKGLAGSIEENGDEAIDAAEDLSGEINGVMNDLAKDMTAAVPTKFSVNGSHAGVSGKTASAGGFTLQLNISTFNNYSTADLEQLTNEIMATAGSFIRRQQEVFA